MKSIDPLPGSACLHAREGGHVRSIRHSQGVGFVPLQPFAGLDAKVQRQLAIDAVNPFVVP